MWVLASPIFDSIWQLKNELFTDETLMPLLTILKEAAQKENEY